MECIGGEKSIIEDTTPSSSSSTPSLLNSTQWNELLISKLFDPFPKQLKEYEEYSVADFLKLTHECIKHEPAGVRVCSVKTTIFLLIYFFGFLF